MIYQRTLRDTVSCTGVGVHSGVNATLTLKPGEINGGFVFVRTDITDKDNVILGRYDKVTETQLCTVLSNESGASISTVEHVLSALVACGVDNATIEIDGPEMPIMDGSAAHFVDMIDDEDIIDEAQDTVTILSNYIEQLNTNVNKTNLDGLIKNLYNEALTVE